MRALTRSYTETKDDCEDTMQEVVAQSEELNYCIQRKHVGNS